MKAKLITILSALTLTAFASASAQADEAEPKLAWQEPGYVMEIVIATAPRPPVRAESAMPDAADPAGTSILAWQEPGYEEEVVVVKASRSEVLATHREVLAATGWFERARPAWSARFMGISAQ